MKINKKSYTHIEQPHVRYQLCIIDRMQSFFALDFENDLTGDHNVGTKAAIQLDALIKQRHGLLPLKRKPQLAQFITDASLIRGFE